MNDTGFLTILLVAIIALLIIVIPLIIKLKKNADKVKPEKDKLTTALTKTKQHLKYKKEVSKITLISLLSYGMLCLSVIFFAFLPVYQIKTELLGETIEIQNFSIFDGFKKLASSKNGGVFMLLFLIICVGLPLFSAVTRLYSIGLKNTTNSDERTLRTFVDEKVIHIKYYPNLGSQVFNYITDIALPTVGPFALFKFVDDNGINSYFTMCNGVSGLIALPIITFAISLILLVVECIFKDKLQKEILKEEVSVS